MPEGYTIRKLRVAIDEIREAKLRGSEDHERLMAALGEPGGLAALAAERARLEDHEIEYLAAFPARLVEGVRAVLHDALASDDPPDIELQFLPGYEFEVRLIEYADQLIIHLRAPFGAPYPRDSFVRKSRST
jgi:hypothetical protein